MCTHRDTVQGRFHFFRREIRERFAKVREKVSERRILTNPSPKWASFSYNPPEHLCYEIARKNLTTIPRPDSKGSRARGVRAVFGYHNFGQRPFGILIHFVGFPERDPSMNAWTS